MTINEFYNEYDDLKDKRQAQGLKSLFGYLVNNKEEYNDLIRDILEACIAIEMDDGFGTEGLDI